MVNRTFLRLGFRLGFTLGFALVLVLSAVAQTIKFYLVPHEVIEQRLEAYAPTNAEREPAIRRLFEEAGCGGDKLAEQPVKGLPAPNLICTMPGEMDAEIVVGAHFDFIEAGHGVVDNWTGASLLPSLYQGLAAVPRRHTFRFVAFSGEEKGMVGSKAYVKELLTTHELVAAMVNMDTLGLAETEVWVSHSDLKLVRWMQVAARSVKLPVSAMDVERVGGTDSESFREKKIPAITIHSVTPQTVKILHSPRDTIDAVDTERYYRSYRLILAYLAVLDQQLDAFGQR